MRKPATHKFLKWAGPAIVAFFGACVGLIAALAQGFPRVQSWAENQFDQWWPVVIAPWFLMGGTLAICAYIAALIYSGRAAPTEEASLVGLRLKPLRERGTNSQSGQWMPFHEALRYLIYDSQRADQQPAVKHEDEFNRVVSAEVRERLARGDIASRGQLGWDEQSERATEHIAAEYWTDAFFLPFGTIALADGQDAVCKQGGGGATYRGVVLRKSDVENTWPRRSGIGLTPLALCVEDLRAKIASEKAPSADDYSDEWNWRVAKHEGRTRIERDKSLGEALAYTGLGRWGGRFSDAAAQGIGAANLPLKKFEQLAYDGRLHVWGKSEQHRDLYEEIPRKHWKNNQVEWFDLLRGKPKTGPRGQTSDLPYYDLMVSRAEFEAVMPHVRHSANQVR